MKLQYLLLNNPSQAISADIKEIETIEQQINDLKTKREVREQNISGEIISIIKRNAKYAEFASILEMKVIDPKKRYSLLSTICMKIGESVAEYKDKEQNYANGFINWGAVFCDIAQEEVKEVFGSFDITIFDNKLKSLNNFLEKYDIRLEWVNAPNDKMRFVAKIFPDK